MVTQILLTHILIDGGILSVIVSTILVLMLYFKPRMALSDYPEDVKAAVPPRTKEELRAGIGVRGSREIKHKPPRFFISAASLFPSTLRQAQGGALLTLSHCFFGRRCFSLSTLNLWPSTFFTSPAPLPCDGTPYSPGACC